MTAVRKLEPSLVRQADLSERGAANGPDPRTLVRELDLSRQALHDLRNPVGAVRLAVQMLRLRLRTLAPQLGENAEVSGIFEALDAATRQLCHLVAPVRQSAAPPTPSSPPMPALQPVPDPRRDASPQPVTEVDDVLRRLEILTVTRSPIPALLAIDAEAGLRTTMPAAELLRALCNLVDNALEASEAASPGCNQTIEIAVWSGSDGRFAEAPHLVFDIRDRGSGLPPSVKRWLDTGLEATGGCPSSKTDAGTHGLGLRGTRRVVEEAGGQLQAIPADPGVRMRIRIPAA